MTISHKISGRINATGSATRRGTLPIQGLYWEHHRNRSDMTLIRGHGYSLDTAFIQIGLGLTALLSNPNNIEPRTQNHLDIRARSLDALLVGWLESLIQHMTTQRTLISAIDVSIRGHHLHSSIWEELYQPSRHQLSLLPHQLRISEYQVSSNKLGLWLADCTVRVV